MEFYDLADVILRPRLAMKPFIDSDELQATQNKFNVNEPQAVAIASVMRTEGISLIQG